MKIDLRKEILNRDGEKVTAKMAVPSVKELDNGEVIEEKTYKTVILTLGNALRDAVLQQTYNLPLDEKMARYNLFLKIEKDGIVDLTDEEIAELKELVATRYEILFCGQIVNMLK
mgnify:CR=1 FL=1